MFFRIFAAQEPISAFDDVSIPTPNDTELPSGEYGFAVLKLFLSLILVLILLGATLWFLRRLIRYRLEKGSGVQAIKVLEKKMISPKTMLYFVEIEGKKIVLAESHLEVRQVKLD